MLLFFLLSRIFNLIIVTEDINGTLPQYDVFSDAV